MGTATRPLERKTVKFCTKKSRVKKSPSVRIGSKIAFEVEFSVTTPRLSPHNAFFLLLIYRSSALFLYRLVVYSNGRLM
jgi:hypothetical protein